MPERTLKIGIIAVVAVVCCLVFVALGTKQTEDMREDATAPLVELDDAVPDEQADDEFVSTDDPDLTDANVAIDPFWETLYAPVLQQYRDAYTEFITGKFDVDKWDTYRDKFGHTSMLAFGASYYGEVGVYSNARGEELFFEAYGPAHYECLLHDIDGNGIPELLIRFVSMKYYEHVIFADIYTLDQNNNICPLLFANSNPEQLDPRIIVEVSTPYIVVEGGYEDSIAIDVYQIVEGVSIEEIDSFTLYTKPYADENRYFRNKTYDERDEMAESDFLFLWEEYYGLNNEEMQYEYQTEVYYASYELRGNWGKWVPLMDSPS